VRIGIDLGGTKIEAIALADSAAGDGAILLRHRVPTPAADYTAILDAVAELVAFTEKHTGQTGTVGIATPGAIAPSTGLLKNSNSTVLNGKPLDRDLEAKLGRPIRMENDANCLALSEAGDPLARACLDLYEDRLARSLAAIVNVLDPDAIVLGGGLSNVTRLYSALPALLQLYTFSADVGTPVLRAKHGDSSGVRGAAWLWPEERQ